MSSPNGKRGHFYENWEHGVEVERIKIIGRECPRIGPEFLEKMRQKLGPMLFAQEFEGEFIDAESSAFSSEMIKLALVEDFDGRLRIVRWAAEHAREQSVLPRYAPTQMAAE